MYLFTDICPVNKDSTEHSLVQVIATVFYSQPVDRFIAGEKIQGKQNEVISFVTKLFQELFVSPQSNFWNFSHIQY